MKIIQEIQQTEIIKFGESVDDRGILKELIHRFQIEWYSGFLTESDITNLCIVFAIDWYEEFNLVRNNDWRLVSVLENFKKMCNSKNENERAKEIKNRKAASNVTLILISESISEGPFWIMDGNRRAVALLDQNKLIGTTIYLGIGTGLSAFGLCAPKF